MICVETKSVTASMEDGLMIVNGIQIDLNSEFDMDFRNGSELIRYGLRIDVRRIDGDSELDVLLDCFWAFVEQEEQDA